MADFRYPDLQFIWLRNAGIAQQFSRPPLISWTTISVELALQAGAAYRNLRQFQPFPIEKQCGKLKTALIYLRDESNSSTFNGYQFL
ncbi:hypothetical protein [Microcoleus sp. FACHB-68]|uniref:hypothetical protein n=1 Tax=Microcoleus sp. FACHB-68 TaxID=2692826 RepID=UPI001687A5F6|nr:hypothetical protein [Microcoleus sp. FACHB-68]MBD1939735.1 hypothetical protein [Microcoleus sp. FACHB-68]